MKTEMAKRYFPALDVLKFAFSLFIIMIHTDFAGGGRAEYLNCFLIDFLARAGVPFFFTVSGYLFANDLNLENEKLKKSPENFKRLKRSFARAAVLYGVWSFLYMFWAVPTQYENPSVKSVIDYLIGTFLKFSYYHLWYVYALVFAYPAIYFCLKFLGRKKTLILAALLYSLNLLTGAYSFLSPDILLSAFNKISSFNFYYLPYCVVFRALPFMSLGAFLSGEEKKPPVKQSGLMFILSFISLLTEVFVLRFKASVRPSYYLLSGAFSGSLVILASKTDFKINKNACSFLGRASTVIYCVHAFFVGFCERFAPFLFENSAMRYFSVLLLSAAASFLIVYLSKKKYTRFLKYLY